MKRYMSLLAVAAMLSSCKDSWPEEYKQQYHKTCYDNAISLSATEEQAKVYCDCVLEKTIAKYPNVEDLLEHMNEVGSDPDIQQCKQLVQKSR